MTGNCWPSRGSGILLACRVSCQQLPDCCFGLGLFRKSSRVATENWLWSRWGRVAADSLSWLLRAWHSWLEIRRVVGSSLAQGNAVVELQALFRTAMGAGIVVGGATLALLLAAQVASL